MFRKGKRPSLEGVAVAAKTGTLIGDKPTRMYSWFVGFAPAEAPEVAIAVLLANDVTWRMKGNEGRPRGARRLLPHARGRA